MFLKGATLKDSDLKSVIGNTSIDVVATFTGMATYLIAKVTIH